MLEGVRYFAVHDSTSKAVPALLVGLLRIPGVDGEESDVVPLSDNDDGDGGVNLQRLAGRCTYIIE